MDGADMDCAGLVGRKSATAATGGRLGNAGELVRRVGRVAVADAKLARKRTARIARLCVGAVSIDMRLPDRLAVQLSDEAAKAREELVKDKKPKKKAGEA